MSKITWSGETTALRSMTKDNTPKALSKVWYLDVQWSDCPVEVQNEVIEIWQEYEFGNDNYIFHTSIVDLMESEYPITAQYIMEQEPDIGHEEQIIIHYWW